MPYEAALAFDPDQSSAALDGSIDSAEIAFDNAGAMP